MEDQNGKIETRHKLVHFASVLLSYADDDHSQYSHNLQKVKIFPIKDSFSPIAPISPSVTACLMKCFFSPLASPDSVTDDESESKQ